MISADTTERVHLSAAEARALSERAMRGIGYEPEEARILADHVIDAALCGYEYSGLPKLLNVADHSRFKAGRSPMRMLRETSVSVLFDGGNQSGMLGMYYATRAVIERAQPHGIALVGVNNIWMSGRSAYYVEMVARAGLIGIHTVAAPPLVAPLGGAKAVLGTNPIAFGFPMEGDPLVIDLGTSAFMGTDLQFRQRLGIPRLLATSAFREDDDDTSCPRVRDRRPDRRGATATAPDREEAETREERPQRPPEELCLRHVARLAGVERLRERPCVERGQVVRAEDEAAPRQMFSAGRAKPEGVSDDRSAQRRNGAECPGRIVDSGHSRTLGTCDRRDLGASPRSRRGLPATTIARAQGFSRTVLGATPVQTHVRCVTI